VPAPPKARPTGRWPPGLSMRSAFKNGTDGSGASTAINRHGSGLPAPIISLAISPAGHAAHRFHTGKRLTATWCCAAAKAAANYPGEAVAAAASRPAKAGLPPRLMVNCSHGNSNKGLPAPG